MIYYILLVILIVTTILFDFFKVKPEFIEKEIFVLLGICLFFMAAFRYDIGYDYLSYSKIFNSVKTSGQDFLRLYKQMAYEPLFFLLMYICRFFSFEVFVFIVSAICVLPKVYYIYKVDTNKYLMLLCYYCSVFLSFDMGIIRQGMSFSIILISVKYIRERKPIKFVIVVFLASLFHTTSIMFLFAYLLGVKETKDKTIIIGIVASFALSMMTNQGILYDAFTDVALKIPIIGNKIADSIYFYKTASQYAGQGLSAGGIINTTLLKRAFVMIVLIVIRRFNEYKDNSEKNISVFNISMNCYFLSILFIGLLSGNGIIASRGTYVLYMFQIPCFGLATGGDKSKNTYHILLLILSVSLFYFTFHGLVNDPIESYLPYRTIFQK